MKNIKNHKVEMLEMENMVKKIKVVFNGPIIDPVQPLKQPTNLKQGQ